MTKKKNVVFILSDDQGEWALGCYGNHEIISPNIDSLANNGVRFENFYCVSPVCSPARASILTGMIPSQHGVQDWLRDDNKKQEEIDYLRDTKTYTEILNENGYICGLSGKWHLGNSSTAQKGFSHWYAHKSGGGPYYNAPMYKNSELIYEEKYITEAITDDAIEFIVENKDKPFYLHIGYTAPHSPWVNNHPKEFTDLYEDCPFETAKMEEKHPNSIFLTDDVLRDLRSNQIGYYAAVTAMDFHIGRIVEKLDKLGIREDTLIVFMADNGFSCGQHGFWGKGNGTFPINMYQSSVKVPCIFNHSGSLDVKVIENPISAYDFMPTLLEYLDIDYKNEDLPGKSFMGILENKKIEDKPIIILDEYGPNRMIIDKDFKFVKRYPYNNHENGNNELYNLKLDPNEKNNLIDDKNFEEIKNDLESKLEKWFLEYVNPEIDGSKEDVYGSGQINLAGAWSNGEKSHSLDDYIIQKMNNK